MTVSHAITELLTRDVSVWGGLQSPLLSWLGSAGLVLFFGWQLIRLFAGVSRATEPFVRLRPLLASLAERVEASDLSLAYDRAFSGRGEAALRAEAAVSGAIDVDQLRDLDQAMRGAAAFRRPWVQFRKTLLIEHVPWFKEPWIFSTRRAEEFFTQEAVLGGRIDLGFSSQVPSLITGLGLLLTFVALCIGLSRLHADGQTITGIQGLINGLAGKFLTSIVGLVCANLFVLLERPVVRRLLGLHGEFLALLDESFPRRTVEDLLDALGRHRTVREVAMQDGRTGGGDRGASGMPERIGASIDELTSVVRVLSERVQEPREAVGALTAAIRALESGQSRGQAQMATLVDRLAALAASPVAAADAAARGGREMSGAVLAGAEAGDGSAVPIATRQRWDWARPRGRRLG